MTREEQLACLEDRPCSVCKFHTDRCSRWTCVFEDEPEEQEPCEDCISREEAIEISNWLVDNMDICEALKKLPSVQPINQNIKALGKELRTFRGGIKDEKVLTGFNMAIALCNKHLADMGGTE